MKKALVALGLILIAGALTACEAQVQQVNPEVLGYTQCVNNKPVFWVRGDVVIAAPPAMKASVVFHELMHVRQVLRFGCERWEFEGRNNPEFLRARELEAYCASWKAAQNYGETGELEGLAETLSTGRNAEIYGDKEGVLRDFRYLIRNDCLFPDEGP